MSNEKLIEQTKGHRFQKGNSGNPGGRRKTQMNLILLARKSVPEAFEVARKIMMEADPEKASNRDRLDAAKFLTVYGLGAPPKVIDDREDESADAMGQLSVEDLRALARQSLNDDAGPTDDAGDDDSDETEH